MMLREIFPYDKYLYKNSMLRLIKRKTISIAVFLFLQRTYLLPTNLHQ